MSSVEVTVTGSIGVAKINGNYLGDIEDLDWHKRSIEFEADDGEYVCITVGSERYAVDAADFWCMMGNMRRE